MTETHIRSGSVPTQQGMDAQRGDRLDPRPPPRTYHETALSGSRLPMVSEPRHLLAQVPQPASTQEPRSLELVLPKQGATLGDRFRHAAEQRTSEKLERPEDRE
jgi:hypothetical protein